jgi:hypothetical protein
VGGVLATQVLRRNIASRVAADLRLPLHLLLSLTERDMQPQFDLTVAIRRLRAIVDEHPRDVLGAVVEADPLQLLQRLCRGLEVRAVIQDPGILLAAAYSSVLERVSSEELGRLDLDGLVADVLTRFALRRPGSALVDVFVKALGCEPAAAPRAIELIRDLELEERRALLSLLRATSPSVAALLPGLQLDLRAELGRAAEATATLRRVLAATFKR